MALRGSQRQSNFIIKKGHIAKGVEYKLDNSLERRVESGAFSSI